MQPRLVLALRDAAKQGLPGSVTRRAGRSADGAAEDEGSQEMDFVTALIALFFLLGAPFGIWMMWMALESDRSHRNDFWSDR